MSILFFKKYDFIFVKKKELLIMVVYYFWNIERNHIFKKKVQNFYPFQLKLLVKICEWRNLIPL